MKNIKAFICALLAVSIFGTAAVTAFAYDNIDGIDYMDDVYRFDAGLFETTAEAETEAVRLITALGIMEKRDSGFSGDETLAREDFELAVLKMRYGLESSYVLSYQKGSSTAKVTFGEAASAMMDVLGYTYEKSLYTGDGEGLIAEAHRLGILNGVDAVWDKYITRESFAQILYNSLTLESRNLDYSNNGSVKGDTILNVIFGAEKVKGLVNAVPGINLYADTEIREGYIEIDRVPYNAEGLSVDGLLGRRVKGYIRNDDENGELAIIYLDIESEDNTLILDFDMIDDVNGSKIEYTEDNSYKKVGISDLKRVVVNGENSSVSAIKGLVDSYDGRIELQKTGGGGYDLAVIWTYAYYQVEAVGYEGDINLRYGAKFKESTRIVLDDTAINRIHIDGENAVVTELLMNDVIRVTQTYDGRFTEIAASRKRFTGKVSSVKNNTVKISSKEYTVANDYQTISAVSSSGAKKLTVGATGDFYTAVDGKLYGYKEGDEYSFAWLKRIIQSEEDEIPGIVIFGEDGEWHAYYFAEKMTLDGKKQPREDAYTTLTSATGIIGDLCRYGLNDDGEVKFLDTMSNTDDEKYDDNKMTHVYSYNNYLDFWRWFLQGTVYQMCDETVVFCVPDDTTHTDEFQIVQIAQLPGNDDSTNVPLDIYNPDRYYLAAAAIYHGTLGATGKDRYFLIEEMTETLNDRDEAIYEVTATTFISEGSRSRGSCGRETFTVTKETADKYNIKPGDWHRWYLSGSEIVGIKTELMHAYTPAAAGYNQFWWNQAYVSGTVIEKNPERLGLIVNYGSGKLQVWPRSYALITKTGSEYKVEHVNYADVRVGDRVYFELGGGHSTEGFMIFRGLDS